MGSLSLVLFIFLFITCFPPLKHAQTCLIHCSNNGQDRKDQIRFLESKTNYLKTVHSEDFDGNSLEEGNYSFTLEGTTSDGTQVEINEIMVGVVDGMSYLEGIPQPSISGIQFDLSMVLRVEMVEKEE